MNFKEILEENDNKNRIYIGYNGKKEKEYIEIKKEPTTIITGETGSGKSVLLNQILCQLIKNNTSLEMEFVFIDSGGVELNKYAETRYATLSSMHDNDKAQKLIYKIKENLEQRHELLNRSNCKNVDEYNLKHQENAIPSLVLAIDDNGTLILQDDVNKLLVDLINLAKGVNFYMFATFSNTNNLFFKNNENINPDNRITFDMSDEEHASLINIDDSEDLPLGKFTLNNGKSERDFFNFDFEDKIIVETLNK